MAAIMVGRVCVKLAGREAGRKCVVVDIIDRNFVLITGPKTVTGVKRRKANMSHIEPLQAKIKIKRGASDEEVVKSLEASENMGMMAERVKPAFASA